MRCELCQFHTSESETSCGRCGARLDEEKHRELFGVRYLLGQLVRWGEDGSCPGTIVANLRRRYQGKRDAIRDRLRAVPVEVSVLWPEAVPKAEIISIVEVPPPPRPPALSEARPGRVEGVVRPAEPPPPPKAFAWRDLLTERNIRWILNLGIFIFSIALAVFVQTQWNGMTPAGRTAILFGATLAGLTAGHFLRKTILKETGTALILLGAIAFPIDFLAVARFYPSYATNALGLVGSIASFGLYLFFARLYRAPAFAWLATGAAACAGAFAMTTSGIAWTAVTGFLVPLLVGVVALTSRLAEMFRRPAWFAGIVLSYALAFLSLGLHLFGALRGIESLEVALAAVVALAIVLRRPGASWAAAAALGGMLWVALDHYGTPMRLACPAMGVFGALMLLSVRWFGEPGRTGHAFPFALVGLLATMTGAGIAGSREEWTWLGMVLAANGVSGIALAGWIRREPYAYVGFTLLGLALVAWASGAGVSPRLQPLLYAGYAVALALAGGRIFRNAASHVAIAAAGLAMFVLSLQCLEYWRPGKPHELGAAISALCALAFGIVARRIGSRFVADLAYGAFGFAYVYALRWIGMPQAWLGVACAGLPIFFFILERRLKLLRPTLFTGVAAAAGCVALALVQWLVAAEFLPAAITLGMVSGFFLAVASKTEHRWVYHVGIYLAAFAVMCACDWGALDRARLAAIFAVPAAAILVARRRGELHLGLAGLAVLLSVLGFTWLDPAMYEKANLPVSIGITLALAGIAACFTFVRPERIDLRVSSGVMGAAAALGYILFLKWMSTGSPWGGLAILAMAFALAAAAWMLRREPRRAHPLLWVSLVVTAVAAGVGHESGTLAVPTYLFVYALALPLHAAIARLFDREEFRWSSAALAVGLGLSLLHFLDHYTHWAGVIVFPLVPLALLVRHPAYRAASVILAVECAAFAMPHDGACFAILAACAALYFGTALLRRSVAWTAIGTLFAAASDARAIAWIGPSDPWCGLVILALAFVLAGAAWILRREERHAQTFLWMSLGVTAIAALAGHLTGTLAVPAHLFVYALGFALHAWTARFFRRADFEWAAAALGTGFGLSLLHYLGHYSDWAGPVVLGLVPLALLARRRAFEGAALVFAVAAILVPWDLATPSTFSAFAAFAIFLGYALWRRQAPWVYAAAIFAALADYRLLLAHWSEPHIGLALLPAAGVFLAMAFEVRRKFGSEFAHPLLGMSLLTSLAATAAALAHPMDRIYLLAADTTLFTLVAVFYRKPVFMYFASAALVALDVAVMSKFGMDRFATAVQLLTLALAQVVLLRFADEKWRPYAMPVFLTALAVAAGVVLFGVANYPTYGTREIKTAIWGLALAALVHGSAGRIRGLPFLIYIGAGHLLGAYYLTLHLYRIETMEFFTLPIGIGLVALSVLAAREKSWRRTLEVVAAGAVFLPSAIASFAPEYAGHVLAALVLAFLLVLAGMVLRRRVFVIGGTACFVAEALGKAIEFLVRAHLPISQWGMLLGGLMILLAAAFELRKVQAIRERAESIRDQARGHFARWD